MNLHRMALAVAGLLIFATCGSAQTVVQLPTFSFTTVNTTVSVPDQGSALMGSVNRSKSGSISRGVPLLGKVPFVNRGFRNQAIGSSTNALQMRAQATIINLDELDEAVLQEAAARRLSRGETLGGERFVGGGMGGVSFAGARAATDPALERRADFLSRNVGRGVAQLPPAPDEPQAPSPEEIRRKNQAAKETRDAEAVAYFDKAEAAVSEGKSGVAKIYYNMAAKRATGDFKTQIADRLEAITAGTQANLATGGR